MGPGQGGMGSGKRPSSFAQEAKRRQLGGIITADLGSGGGGISQQGVFMDPNNDFAITHVSYRLSEESNATAGNEGTLALGTITDAGVADADFIMDETAVLLGAINTVRTIGPSGMNALAKAAKIPEAKGGAVLKKGHTLTISAAVNAVGTIGICEVSVFGFPLDEKGD